MVGGGVVSSEVERQAARRRTFAIISHPDAGKMTLPEKFLLYAGQIEEAGAVKSRKRQRTVTSDWMELEQQRGISIATAVLRFEHREPHGEFLGVVDRRTECFHRYTRVAHGATEVPVETTGLEQACRAQPDLDRELALLAALGNDHDQELFEAGMTTPVFFGSALSNFGVRLLLDAIVETAPSPLPRLDTRGVPRPLDAPVSALVFKVQANMDPRHRDRLAFLRICSGRFQRGQALTCARDGSQFAGRYAHQLFGRERATVEEAWPGDVIGLVNAMDLQIGDTLYVDEPVTCPPPPTFTPEHFRLAYPADCSRAKQFRTGIAQLDEEGIIQVLRRPELGDQQPVLAAVGQLQFDVAAWRLDHEFRAPVRLEEAPFEVVRRTDEPSIDRLQTVPGVAVYRRSSGMPLALFRDRWQVERIERDHPDLCLQTVVTG